MKSVALLLFVHQMPPMNTVIHAPRVIGLTLALTALTALVGCGGGDDSPSSGGGTTPPTAIIPVTANDVSQNNARLADLNGFRSQSGGTALPNMSSHDALIIAAVRHAGWQAIDNTGLNHGEPRSNALFTADNFFDRIKAGNGGASISGANGYSEGIAGNAGSSAITLLWNSVYHRLAMMRHQTTKVGYGDKDMARANYPSAGVSAGNGLATLDYVSFGTPAVTLAFWPGNGTTNVPRTFNSDSEGPDPVAGRNQVGCPIHLILPAGSGTFSAVNVTLVTGSTHIPLMVMAGNGSPVGPAGDVASLAGDSHLAPGEVFIIPIPNPTNTGLAASTSYTYNASVTFNGTTYSTGDVTYTTGP